MISDKLLKFKVLKLFYVQNRYSLKSRRVGNKKKSLAEKALKTKLTINAIKIVLSSIWINSLKMMYVFILRFSSILKATAARVDNISYTIMPFYYSFNI